MTKLNPFTTLEWDIKRIVIANFDESLVKPVSERFMELAKVKFG